MKMQHSNGEIYHNNKKADNKEEKETGESAGDEQFWGPEKAMKMFKVNWESQQEKILENFLKAEGRKWCRCSS